MDLRTGRLAVLACVTLTCGLLAVTASGAQTESPPGDRFADLRRVIEIEKAWSGAPGLAVGVTREGRLLYEQANGLANVELQVPMTPSTVVQLSSSSKMFTGVAALVFAHEGLLDLDAPARRYLPELPETWSEVTVRHLLTHTSGLPEVLECETDSRDEAWACVTERPVPNAPGERFRYNQTNYFLALEILERLSGQAFPDLVQERVFTPAGMLSTTYAGCHRDVVPGRATSYYPAEDGGLELREFDFPDYLYSAAGLNASLEDLLRFDAALFAGRLVPTDELPRLWEEPTLDDGSVSSYGLGWDLRTHNQGLRSAGHEGGRLTTIRHFLDARMTVVVLANGSSSRFDPDRLALLVADVVVPGTAEASATLTLRMRESLLDGDLQSALATYREFVADPRDAGEETENEINRLGYDLLGRRRTADAVAIFRLNVERYPESANAHDSLGEGLAELGQTDAAISHYRESLRLDPSNDNATRRIEALEARRP